MSERDVPAVFLSYASEDAEAAREICAELRAAEIEVWFDQNELRGGDAWDEKIRSQIKSCALFVPIISAHSNARPEGYFRLEWKLAVDRSHQLADDHPFLFPVLIDDTSDQEARVPAKFRDVQWTRLTQGGRGLSDFAREVRTLLARRSSGEGVVRAPGPIVRRPSVPQIADYELLRLVGRGAYGEVWLGRALTGTLRAIKIVWRDQFEETGPFEREFRGLVEFSRISLQEPGQLAVLHVGRDEQARFFYYVMELADDASGVGATEPTRYVPLTFKELLAKRGRIAPAECLAFAITLARALAALHARDLIHRDIKPANIVLVGGAPKLADIGLLTTIGQAQTFVGTAGYVPPEGPGTPAADVFALGKVIYQLATGLDCEDFPRLPDDLGSWPDKSAFLQLNRVVLRACDPASGARYRRADALLADLERLGGGSSRRPTRRSGQPIRAALAAFVLAALAGTAWWWHERPVAARPATRPPTSLAAAENSVAVLPFANLGGEKEQDYFSDGLAAEILDALARERGLHVVGRTSSFSFKGRNLPAPEIAQALKVARLVEGTVRQVGNRVRISVQLTQGANGYSEELGQYDRELTDIFALQDEVAGAVVEKLTGRKSARSVAALTHNIEAYDSYLRGRELQLAGPQNSEQAVRLYQRAVELDPNFALAWVRLAEARSRDLGYESPPQMVADMRAAANRALTLQPNLPEALLLRARISRVLDGDLDAAGRDVALAATLQPISADLSFAQCLLARSRNDWPAAFRHAAEYLSLDPQNGDGINVVALVPYAWCGNYHEADRLLGRAMAIQAPENSTPFMNRIWLRARWRGIDAALRFVDRTPDTQAGKQRLRAYWLSGAGRKAEARAVLEAMERQAAMVSSAGGKPVTKPRFGPRTLRTLGREEAAHEVAEQGRRDVLEQISQGNRAPGVWDRLAGLEEFLGHQDAARRALAELRQEVQKWPPGFMRLNFLSEFDVHDTYARLGMKDEALAFLEELDANGCRMGYWLRDDPELSVLRDDPRFVSLRQKNEAWAAAQPDPDDDPVAAKR